MCIIKHKVWVDGAPWSYLYLCCTDHIYLQILRKKILFQISSYRFIFNTLTRYVNVGFVEIDSAAAHQTLHAAFLFEYEERVAFGRKFGFCFRFMRPVDDQLSVTTKVCDYCILRTKYYRNTNKSCCDLVVTFIDVRRETANKYFSGKFWYWSAVIRSMLRHWIDRFVSYWKIA